MGEEITDRLVPEVGSDRTAEEDFNDFWAYCIDFINCHEKHISLKHGEPVPIVKMCICGAYCAATWVTRKERERYRISRSLDRIDLDELKRKVAALKKERAQLKAKIRKAEKKVKNAKKGGKS